MKAYKAIIFLFSMILILGGSFWFSNLKNIKRFRSHVKIKFTHTPLLIDTLLVNKLLTQNLNQQLEEFEESLDLNMIEFHLKSIPEVQNIEVYKLLQGGLAVEVTERKPLFEVSTNKRYFGDAKGILFDYHLTNDLNLPIFKMDSTITSLVQTADLISKLKNDPLLDIELETIYLNKDEYIFKLRSFPFVIVLGDSTRLKQKIKKLKVFCAFQINQDNLKGFNKINLSYKNQVVATTL